MNVHFTLLLASRAAILLHHLGDSLERAMIIPYDMPVLKKTLADAMLARSEAPLAITLDTEALDLRVDEIPPVAPWQKQQLIDRQRAFHFPGAAFCGSVQAGKNGAVLHAATEVDDKIHKTLEGLYNIGNPVNAASFFAVECAHIISEMPDVPRHPLTLMLILGEATGLRQIVLKDGVPVFTRLHTECTPTTPRTQLAGAIARHIQSTRDFLPRLNLGALDALHIQLFVPETLKDLEWQADVPGLKGQTIALQSPRPDLVPPEWGLDLALLARVAVLRKRYMPFAPDWLKGRTQRTIIRQDVSIIMFVFGCAGIAFGLQTLLGQYQMQPPAPPAVHQEVAPAVQPKEAAPTPVLNLEAVMYNGPDDWSVWINGEKYAPDHKSGAVTILDVTADSVHVRAPNGEELTLKAKNAASGTVNEN